MATDNRLPSITCFFKKKEEEEENIYGNNNMVDQPCNVSHQGDDRCDQSPIGNMNINNNWNMAMHQGKTPTYQVLHSVHENSERLQYTDNGHCSPQYGNSGLMCQEVNFYEDNDGNWMNWQNKNQLEFVPTTVHHGAAHSLARTQYINEILPNYDQENSYNTGILPSQYTPNAPMSRPHGNVGILKNANLYNGVMPNTQSQIAHDSHHNDVISGRKLNGYNMESQGQDKYTIVPHTSESVSTVRTEDISLSSSIGSNVVGRYASVNLEYSPRGLPQEFHPTPEANSHSIPAVNMNNNYNSNINHHQLPLPTHPHAHVIINSSNTYYGEPANDIENTYIRSLVPNTPFHAPSFQNNNMDNDLDTGQLLPTGSDVIASPLHRHNMTSPVGQMATTPTPQVAATSSLSTYLPNNVGVDIQSIDQNMVTMETTNGSINIINNINNKNNSGDCWFSQSVRSPLGQRLDEDNNSLPAFSNLLERNDGNSSMSSSSSSTSSQNDGVCEELLDDLVRDLLISKGKKRDSTYIALISRAIFSSPEKKMLLSDIYDYLSKSFKLDTMNSQAWRNSVRHNLSLNECFVKHKRLGRGRGHYWSIHPACVEDFARGDFRRRQARRLAQRNASVGGTRGHGDRNGDAMAALRARYSS